MSLLSTLVVTFLSCAPQGELRLPPSQEKPAAPRPAAADEVARFRRTLLDLRTAGQKQELMLMGLPSQYGDLEDLTIQVARKARAREMQDLMLVARRYGSTKVADELLFQLLTRALGDATRDVMATMVQLKGEGAKVALMECARGRISGVRRAATEQLIGLVGPDDLTFVQEMLADQSLDQQLLAIELLGAVRSPDAQRRLGQFLTQDPTLAGAACTQLLRLGGDAVPVLQQVAQEPPIDRAHAYAAFALAQIQAQQPAAELLPAAVADALRKDLDDPDVTTRALAAIALADLAFRSDDPDPARFRDADIVAALLQVVAPTGFVPNLSLLREPAETRLVALTGRTANEQGMGWREWWQVAKEGFQGLRARVRVDESNAGRSVLELRTAQGHLRLLGEDLAATASIAGASEIVLTAPRMLTLVRQLEQLGFMRGALDRSVGLPRPRSLQLQVQGARCQTAAAAQGAPEFDRLAVAVEEVQQEQLWQLFRDPVDEPDRAAFWRAERRWLEANPDKIEHGRRFLDRLTKVWPRIGPGLRTRGLGHLFAQPDKAALLGEDDGVRLVELVQAAQELGPNELLLLELAAAAPGDEVWRRCIDVAWRMPAGGRAAVQRLFALLGPDRVLAALADERPVVQQAAIDEVVRMRDLRAAPRLVTMLDDDDPDVRRAAVFAAGAVPVLEARERMIQLIAAEDTDPVLRRECLRSLGKIGGEGAFRVLHRALDSPVREDRDAALRGIGELREQRAADLMAELFVAAQGNENGELARFYLQRMGSLLAVPALRMHLTVTQPVTRRELVLLLGSLQDPLIVPELLELLRQGSDNLRVVALLEGVTGLDITSRDDRIAFLEQWYRQARGQQQYQWLLAALRAADVPTTLKPEQFEAGAGLAPVPELARLMVESLQPRLRVLAAAVLRGVAGEDFGAVTAQTPTAAREAIAARYRALYESARAARAR